MPHPKVEDVARYAASHFGETVQRLAGYLRYPAISCETEHEPDVRALAEQIRNDLARLGFDRARLCELPGALPLVAGERLRAGKDRPTVVVYGHLDLQPVRGESWDTNPHELVERDGRLYARGAADDMGGWVSHLAALQAWLEVAGELPINVKLVIESEEEIGSPNLERFMDAYPDVFESDVMVLTDCENPATDIPGLTTSLRGLYQVEITCAALRSDVHSGLWGNMVPDAGNALIRMLARLIDADTRLAIGRREVDPEWTAQSRDVPLDADVIRSGARLLDGIDPLPEHGRSPAEWLWRQPAITVLSTTFPRPVEHKNAIRAAASATLSIRLAPGQTRQEMRAVLESELLSDPPGGVRVQLRELEDGGDSWLYQPSGPAFDAADRAYEKAWGKKLLPIGIGGSIPFVAMFGRRFSNLPLILNGVMDPETGPHGPNESMAVDVFRKAILANVYLLDELSALQRAE